MPTTHIALLRAVNVGGTGKLPMADLRALAEAIGFDQVRTYIQSGNLVFASPLSAAKAKGKLETALAAKLGKPCAVLMRTANELDAVLAANPFPEAAPNQLLIVFLNVAPPQEAIQDTKIPGSERLHLAGRELYVHFPEGMGNSKLKVPFAKEGTARNLNTVRKLLEMARDAG